MLVDANNFMQQVGFWYWQYTGCTHYNCGRC